VTYDPFGRGPFPAGVRTLRAVDAARERRLPIGRDAAAAGFLAGDVAAALRARGVEAEVST